MVEINLKLDQGVPQYVCSSCRNCHSVYGKSLCSIKNRGCCWYFPKFTLYEIHKMVKDSEGLEILDKLLKLPKIEVYHYYLHAKGYFDEAGYKKYLGSGQASQNRVEDKSIFFRVCPMVKPGAGCTLPAKYRSYVCNLFICDEIYGEAKKQDIFKSYIDERNNYVRWIEWENCSLEELLREKKLSLLSNPDGVINFLQDVPLENYEFPSLPDVEASNEFRIGA